MWKCNEPIDLAFRWNVAHSACAAVDIPSLDGPLPLFPTLPAATAYIGMKWESI